MAYTQHPTTSVIPHYGGISCFLMPWNHCDTVLVPLEGRKCNIVVVLSFQCITHSSASIYEEIQDKSGFQPNGLTLIWEQTSQEMLYAKTRHRLKLVLSPAGWLGQALREWHCCTAKPAAAQPGHRWQLEKAASTHSWGQPLTWIQALPPCHATLEKY